MIKIYIKNKLRIFKSIKDYFKDLKERPCCNLYLILTFSPQQVPPPPGGCFNGSINYSGFTSIDFTSIGGTINIKTIK